MEFSRKSTDSEQVSQIVFDIATDRDVMVVKPHSFHGLTVKYIDCSFRYIRCSKNTANSVLDSIGPVASPARYR